MSRYASIIHQYKNGVEFSLQGAKSFASSVSWRTGLTVGAVFLVLYGVTFLGFLAWAVWEFKFEQCCCFRKFRDSKQLGSKEFKLLSPIVMVGLLAMGVAIVILVIAWSVFIGSMVKKVPDLKCTGGILYTRIMNGYRVDEFATPFIGLLGIAEAIGNLTETSKALRESRPLVNSIATKVKTIPKTKREIDRGYTKLTDDFELFRPSSRYQNPQNFEDR